MLKLILVVFVFITTMLSTEDADARCYSRSYTRNVINKTDYLIDQAYDMAYTYDYWSEHQLSKAIYYNDYAHDLYSRRHYKTAVRYSLKAREYALNVIDACDDYWEFFYFTYFGWSHTYGYNNNFTYSSGYANGYYDGYFAAYCDRHHHHHNPQHHHHNPHQGHQPPQHGHQPPHPNNNDNGHAIGRGETGAINPNVSTGNSGITRSGYKNINFDEYFSDDEIKELKDMPTDESLEIDFRKDRPNVVFDNKEISKPNTEIVQRTKERSQTYARNTGITEQSKPTKQIVTPKQKDNTNTTITKPNRKQITPKETKPVRKEVNKPSRRNNKQINTGKENSKPQKQINKSNNKKERSISTKQKTPSVKSNEAKTEKKLSR